MASLRNMRVNSKVSRVNDVLVNSAIEAHYSVSNMGAGMAITVRAKDRQAPDARDYRVELNTVDLGIVIETLLNPIKHFTLSAFASTNPPSNGDNYYRTVLEEHGIKYNALIDILRYLMLTVLSAGIGAKESIGIMPNMKWHDC
jgi:hypothetical protein